MSPFTVLLFSLTLITRAVPIVYMLIVFILSPLGEWKLQEGRDLCPRLSMALSAGILTAQPVVVAYCINA